MKKQSEAVHRKQESEAIAAINDYAAVLNAINDAVFIYEIKDPQPPGNFIYVNDAAVALTEYSRADLMKLTPVDISAHLTIDDITLFRSELIRTGVITKEITFVTRTGRKTTVEFKATRTVVEGRKIGLAVARNITDRVKSENELKESERRYRYLATNVPVGVVEVDLINDRFIEVNDELCKMSGYTREELLSTPTSVFFNAEGMKVRKERLAAVTRGDEVPNEVEYQLGLKNGEFRWFLIKIRHTLREGKIVGGTAIMYDITERKAKEKKIEGRLKELENNLDEKKAELKGMNLDLVAKKGELDRITSEYELIRQQVLENKKAIATLAKNMEQIHREAETQIMMDLKKAQLPILERMKNDRRLESYSNDIDYLIRQFSPQSSLHSEKTRIVYSLTPSELQVARLIGQGMSSEEIASYLNISLNTVKTHRKNIRKKLGLQDSKTNLISYLKPHL